MQFKMVHQNFNVLDLERSLTFYREALGLVERRRKESKNGDYTLAFVGNETSSFELELTYLHGRTEPYDLGEGEYHLAFRADDFETAHSKHAEMGCICFENYALGVYFIEDPDGYWLEILPERK